MNASGAMVERLSWQRDGADWPLRAHSRFVVAGGLRWHLQELGQGPTALLIHGTGASTHSWRDLAPRLAPALRLLAVDLPGHAFTEMPPSRQLSLPGMALALGALMRELGVAPEIVIGHSAGAAIGARMALDGQLAPRLIMSLNGAFLPFGGLAGPWFAPVARLMAALPFVPRLFALRASDPAVLRRLIDGTGSRLDDNGVALYGRLVRSPGHAAAALAMMANWDLPSLKRDLPRLRPALALVVGDRDRTVPPAQARAVRALVPGASELVLPGLGHLAHEERPDEVARHLLRIVRATGTASVASQGVG